MTRRTFTGLLAGAAVGATLALPAAPAAACQPEYCPPSPLLCEWGPFAGRCTPPY